MLKDSKDPLIITNMEFDSLDSFTAELIITLTITSHQGLSGYVLQSFIVPLTAREGRPGMSDVSPLSGISKMV